MKKRKNKYLPLKDVTNMYSQFRFLSPKDKREVNRQFEMRMQFRHLQKLLALR